MDASPTDDVRQMNQPLAQQMQQIGLRAREASRTLARASTGDKNRALIATAEALQQHRTTLLHANGHDLEAARARQLEPALIERLTLNDARIDAMIESLHQVAALADPVGAVTDLRRMPSGIEVGRMRVPLGVIGIIYESRPSVTAEAASLCLKSGNAAILRGGSESHHSNRVIAQAIQHGLATALLPDHAIQVLESTDRAAVGHLITMPEHVDVIIPRGGRGLIERISQEARIPVIKHLDGICHLYVDAHADLEMALKLAVNAKTHRYGVCNAMETLLVCAAVAERFLPLITDALKVKGVELRGCTETRRWVPDCTPACDEDWITEYLAPILSIRVVAGLDEAIDHINRHGSHHTDGIITQRLDHACRFITEVNSSSVMVNASTRFADGFEYGLGAEIGISTDKLHARGPVGLEGLTSQKYVVLGDGHIRQ